MQQKRFTAALLALLIFLTCAVCSAAAGQNAAQPAQAGAEPLADEVLAQYGQKLPLVFDDAGYFTQAETAELTQRLEALSAKYNVRVGIATFRRIAEESAQPISQRIINDERFGYPDGANGAILLVIAKQPRQYNIKTNKKMVDMISTDETLPYIGEELLPALQDDRYGDAAKAYASAVGYSLQYYADNGKPYDPADDFDIIVFLAALFFAIIFGIEVRKSMVKAMSNVAPATSASQYLVGGSFRLTGKVDQFVRSYTRVVKHKKSSGSSSGSSSSHDSDGGGSYGGRY